MSVNAATDYTPWEPIDLASLELFFARARFLRKRHPSEELVACKYDLVACFRQLPLRRREWARVGATCRQRILRASIRHLGFKQRDASCGSVRF